MMTVKKFDGVGQAQTYFKAEKGGIASYYSKEENAYGGGQWFGKGAKALGLEGAVQEKDWVNALHGKFKQHGKHIQVGIADLDQRRPGVDLTFSPPKSVSIVALALGDQRVVDAHDRAVAATLRHIEERHLYARMGKGGTEHVKTGSMCAALYRHTTSRPVNGVVDSQLHTHAAVLNVTQRPDGKFVSANLGGEDGWIKSDGAYYRNELAANLRELGYGIDQTQDSFEIAGITREMIDAFSHRSQQVESELEKQGKNRATASAEEKTAANLKTRTGKTHQSSEELNKEWGDRAAAAGISREIMEASQQKGAARTTITDPKAIKEAATDYIQAGIQHRAERECAFSESEILENASIFAAGRVRGQDLLDAMDREKEAGQLLPATEGRVTTQEAIQTEKNFIERIKKGLSAVTPISTSTPAVLKTSSDKTLNGGQTDAAKHILETQDRFVAIQGVAGAGKTTAMECVREQAEASGFQVIGLAPTHKAARELRDAGIKDVYTVARISASMIKNVDDKTLFIVDECSMISATAMAALAKQIEQVGARAAFVGDTRQLQAIEAGAPFRQMQEHAATTTIDEIQRQKNPELKKAVEAFAAGKPAEGAKLAQPFMHECDFSELKNEKGESRFENEWEEREAKAAIIARDASHYFLDHSKEWRDRALVITGTNAMREEINAHIRDGLKQKGEIGKDEVTIKTLEKVDFTNEQIKHTGSYQTGQYVEFRRDYEARGVSSSVQKDHQYKITALDHDKNKITLEDRDTHKKIEWNPSVASKVTISKEVLIEVSVADQLVIRANDNEREIVSGDRATVKSIDDGKVMVETDRGISTELKVGEHAQHFYCRTVHSSQGATCDHEVGAAPSWLKLAVAEQGYVGMSRAKEDAAVFTDSKADLSRAWAKSVPKEAALEARDVILDDRARGEDPPVPARNLNPKEHDHSQEYGRGR